MSALFEVQALQHFERIEKTLNSILSKHNLTLKEILKMSAQMDALVEAVTAEDTEIKSVITMLGTINGRIADIQAQLAQAIADLQAANVAVADLEAVNAQAVTLHDDIESQTAALAAAVAAVPPVTP